MKLHRYALLVLLPVSAAYAADKAPKPGVDPTQDPLMITAGFLTHHPDMQYRIWGLEAYNKKHYEDAMRLFRRASFYADKPSQGMVAEMLWNGQGAAQNRALAYAWMDLAAERGYAGFLGLRERYWNALNEDERRRAVEEGQAVYAQFGDAAAKPRYESQLRRGRMKVTGSRTGYTGNLQIIVPGPAGDQTIEGSKFYDPRFWDADKYWAYTDQVWGRPRIGRVTVGEMEQAGNGGPPPSSRVPETKPEIDAAEPEVPAVKP